MARIVPLPERKKSESWNGIYPNSGVAVKRLKVKMTLGIPNIAAKCPHSWGRLHNQPMTMPLIRAADNHHPAAPHQDSSSPNLHPTFLLHSTVCVCLQLKRKSTISNTSDVCTEHQEWTSVNCFFSQCSTGRTNTTTMGHKHLNHGLKAWNYSPVYYFQS